jgi:hypothetical protein
MNPPMWALFPTLAIVHDANDVTTAKLPRIEPELVERRLFASPAKWAYGENK